MSIDTILSEQVSPVHPNQLIIVHKYKGETPKLHRTENGNKVLVREGPILARVHNVVKKNGVGSRGKKIGTGWLVSFSDASTGFNRSYYLEQAEWELAPWRVRLNDRMREICVSLSEYFRTLSKRFELS